MGTKRGQPSRMKREFADVSLGDERLDRRCVNMVGRLAARPGESIPRAMVDPSEVEGAYRFFANDDVAWRQVLAPHVEATVKRASVSPLILAVHDTSAMPTPGVDAEEIGYLNTGKAGFYAHVSLLTGLKGEPPFGVGHVEVLTRDKPPTKRKKGTKTRKRSGAETRRKPDRESLRWLRGVKQVDEALGDYASRVVHVMDREADIFDLLAAMTAANHRFVLRMARDRCAQLDSDDEVLEPAVSKVRALLASEPHVLERNVELSKRKDKSTPRRSASLPPRAGRTTTLHIAAARLELQPPNYQRRTGPISVNVVQVREAEPDATSPVEWVLFTSEPIETPADVAQVVDIYRRRWLIEELFKVLKTGCQYDERMLEEADGMYRLFAMMLPIAWHLLHMREMQRANAQVPANAVLNGVQFEILQRKRPGKLTKNSTAADALLLVASLAGHLRHNGPPGWESLYVGMQRLLDLEEGYRLAAKM